MKTQLNDSLVSLEPGAFLRVHGTQGGAIVVFKGLVWITQNDNPRDYFLAGGQTFTIDRPGVVLVEAMRDSSVLVLQADSETNLRDEPIRHDERAGAFYI